MVLERSTMVLGRSTMVLGRSTMVLGRSTVVLGSSTMVLGRSTMVLGKSTMVSGLVWSGLVRSDQYTTLFQLQTCLFLFIQTLTLDRQQTEFSKHRPFGPMLS